jgi:hypothetical protein
LRASLRTALFTTVLAALAACSTTDARESDVLPATKWDHRSEAPLWTEASLEALRSYGSPLVSIVPADAETWCPGYDTATASEREAFWVGQWFGLVQISPATARGYGCDARSADALKDGTENLSCAIRIWSRTVTRDGVIAAGGGGVAADWGPFHQSSKRQAMMTWTRAQPYCQA